jgi:competence/damage-inducible protein CinA-like protein
MNAEIIAVGSELLLGETIDTNSAYLARHLAGMGIGLYRKAVVGDNEVRIATMIEEALARVDLVICTGGLGPTVDDVTREAVARAVGRPLVFHPALLEQIEARFRSFGRTMSPSNRRQAYVPEGAQIVENPVGTAPSFIVSDERGTVVVLPGVPSEMRYLWEHAITPYLRDERGETGVILVHTLYATGMSESTIGEIIADLMEQENPTVGISAKRGQYELRIGARAEHQAAAAALVAETEATLRERLGEVIIGNETLEQSVVTALRARGLTLAIAEATLRAPIWRAVQATPGGGAIVRGVQLWQADGAAGAAAERAHAAARAVREQYGAAVGLGACVGDRAADGFSDVWLACDGDLGAHRWSRRIDLNTDEGWGFIATSAFDTFRRLLGEQ